MKKQEPNADKLGLDYLGLIDCYRLFGNFAVADTIKVYATNHPIPELVSLGWLKPAKSGRWTEGFAPAGALAKELKTAHSPTHSPTHSLTIK